MTGPVRVGVLSIHTSKETKAICNAVEALGHEAEWLRAENVAVDIEDGATTLSPDVDVLLNRLLLSNTELPAELLGLARTLSSLRPMLNPPADVLTAFHKFAAATTLADAGIRVPDALLALDADRLNEGRARFGDAAVYKTAIGTHGGGTWRVEGDEQVNPVVGDRYAFLQEMIDTDPDTRNRDLRVYVVGGEVIAAMFRYAPDEDWRTNVALGGSVEGVPLGDLPEEAERFAVDATEAVGLDYAGVDLVEGEEGWYVLEVNPTAGFRGLFRATDTSPAPHLAALAVEEAGVGVDDDAVASLAAELDDSRPRCVPPTVEGAAEEPRTIGYTEEVLVSGTSGTERVVAKSDTGAARTSIDTSLAAEIGAGPVKSLTKVRSGTARAGKSRAVVDIVVAVGGDRHTVAASLEDRSHMSYSLLLGRDILEHYRIDVRRCHDDADAEREEEEETEESGE
jgi:RimK family alpha-L-glutamate ligase